MSACALNTILNATTNAGKNVVSPQIGQGIYIGNYYPGSTSKVISSVNTMMPSLGAEIVIQNDNNPISTLSAQPQNVLRLTGAFGANYIQGSNIVFSVPYSGANHVSIQPSTGTINTIGNVNANSFFSANTSNNQPLMSQNYNFTLNTTSTIAFTNMAWEPINGGSNGVALRCNFYDASGNLRWVRDI